MKGFKTVIRIFPAPLQRLLCQLPVNIGAQIQEIRLRKGNPLVLAIRGKAWYLTTDGQISEDRNRGAICQEEWVENTFEIACDRSVYTHQEELRNGYITTREGYRIGVGGTAVVRGGKVDSFRNIRSLCVRIAREHHGCAAEIAKILYANNTIHSALICGEPSSGKTSLLRDLIYQFDRQGLAVAVIDERGELTGSGKISAGDTLLYTPKAVGVEMAVRTLSPQVIVFDELGDNAEIDAVLDSVCRGVTVITTIHGSVSDLVRRPTVYRSLQQGAFEYIFFLKGHDMPGKIDEWYRTEDWLHEMGRTYFVGNNRDRYGMHRLDKIATTGEDLATLFAVP